MCVCVCVCLLNMYPHPYPQGCSGDERDMANQVAGAVSPSSEPVKIQEGSEPEAFWEALGGKGEYASGKMFEVRGELNLREGETEWEGRES